MAMRAICRKQLNILSRSTTKSSSLMTESLSTTNIRRFGSRALLLNKNAYVKMTVDSNNGLLACRGTTTGRASMIVRGFATSYPSHEIVAMPALSPTMETGTVVQWSLKVGDSFAPGTAFCEVATDKATMSFEAQDDGYVAKFLVPAGGGDIKVGDPILVTVQNAEDVAAFADFELPAGGGIVAATAPVAAPAAVTPVAASIPAAPTPVAPAAPSSGRTVASPLARKLWRENPALAGHSMSLVQGSGPGGRIVAADVVGFTVPVASAAATTTATTAAGAPVATTVVNDGGVTTAAASSSEDWYGAQYTASKQTIPHYYLSTDVDMSAVVAMRARMNAAAGTGNGKNKGLTVSVSGFIIKASAHAMRQVPDMNASWVDTAVRRYDQVHMNVMLGLGEEIQCPVLKNTGAMGLTEIASELTAFESNYLATDVSSSPSIEVGTFTIHNLGMYGVKSVSPIIMPGQAGALGCGAIVDTVVPNPSYDADTEPSNLNPNSLSYKVAPVMTLTLSCDHRVVDGAVGAGFLAHVKKYLEDPVSMLL